MFIFNASIMVLSRVLGNNQFNKRVTHIQRFGPSKILKLLSSAECSSKNSAYKATYWRIITIYMGWWERKWLNIYVVLWRL